MPTTLKNLNQLDTTINGTQNSGRKSDYSFDLQNLNSSRTGQSNQDPLQDDDFEDIEQMTAIKSMISPRTELRQRDPLELLMIICGGVGLAFNSGLMNGITLTAHEVPSSHVTGINKHTLIHYTDIHLYTVLIYTHTDIIYILTASLIHIFLCIR